MLKFFLALLILKLDFNDCFSYSQFAFIVVYQILTRCLLNAEITKDTPSRSQLKKQKKTERRVNFVFLK